MLSWFCKGVEISGVFVRRNGQIALDLTIFNRALQNVGDFGLQINKNTFVQQSVASCHQVCAFNRWMDCDGAASFGILPAGHLNVRNPLPPNQSFDTTLSLTLNSLTHSQPCTPINNIQVVYFECLHLLLGSFSLSAPPNSLPFPIAIYISNFFTFPFVVCNQKQHWCVLFRCTSPVAHSVQRGWTVVARWIPETLARNSRATHRADKLSVWAKLCTRPCKVQTFVFVISQQI